MVLEKVAEMAIQNVARMLRDRVTEINVEIARQDRSISPRDGFFRTVELEAKRDLLNSLAMDLDMNARDLAYRWVTEASPSSAIRSVEFEEELKRRYGIG